MGVGADFAECADTEGGRPVDALRNLGQLENTLVLYIVGDDGTSAGGGMNGLFIKMT
jgi:arylsulfatase A-like enzyme